MFFHAVFSARQQRELSTHSFCYEKEDEEIYDFDARIATIFEKYEEHQSYIKEIPSMLSIGVHFILKVSSGPFAMVLPVVLTVILLRRSYCDE
jgi:hypothetical protein